MLGLDGSRRDSSSGTPNSVLRGLQKNHHVDTIHVEIYEKHLFSLIFVLSIQSVICRVLKILT